MSTRVIHVAGLARIEGEAGLRVRLRDGKVAGVELKVFEPPRFFEAFLRGRRFDEVPDIVARICGICPVAHQLTAIASLEQSCNVEPDPDVVALRRLIYLGEWIESHALHIYLLHAPDFVGAQDALQLAGEHRDLVERALRLKRIGNDIMRVVGGREIHPINLRVGGFYSLPDRRKIAALLDDLRWAHDAAIETVRWTSGLPIPQFEQEYEFVSLRHPQGYPLVGGRIATSGGLDILPGEYEEHFEEDHVRHSNALQSTMKPGRKPYLVGPLARLSMNFDRLVPEAQQAAREAGLTTPCVNPFLSIVVRSVELVQACTEALALVENYTPPKAPAVAVTPRAARSAAVSEAPRGLLYHRYAIDGRGIVLEARIVPPTAQNLRMMERDLGAFVAANSGLADEELTWRCEQAMRNYDPCISCATHFLRLDVDRGGA